MPVPTGLRAFQVVSPLRVQGLLLALAVPLELLVTRINAALIHDATLSAIVPFLGTLVAAAVLLWPRRLVVGRDGAAIAGFLGEYRSWDEVASVRLQRGYRGRVTIAVTCRGGAIWTVEPHSEVDAASVAEQMEARRCAFASSQFERMDPQEGTAHYRVASTDMHVRVLEDPRNPLDDRVTAARTLASVDRARAPTRSSAWSSTTRPIHAREGLSVASER